MCHNAITELTLHSDQRAAAFLGFQTPALEGKPSPLTAPAQGYVMFNLADQNSIPSPIHFYSQYVLSRTTTTPGAATSQTR